MKEGGLSVGRYEFMVFVWIHGFFDGVDNGENRIFPGKFDYAMCHVGHGIGEWDNRAVPMNTMVCWSVSLCTSPIGLIVVDGVRCVRSFVRGGMYRVFGDGLR
jgi:hypothetical protein